MKATKITNCICLKCNKKYTFLVGEELKENCSCFGKLKIVDSVTSNNSTNSNISCNVPSSKLKTLLNIVAVIAKKYDFKVETKNNKGISRSIGIEVFIFSEVICYLGSGVGELESKLLSGIGYKPDSIRSDLSKNSKVINNGIADLNTYGRTFEVSSKYFIELDTRFQTAYCNIPTAICYYNVMKLFSEELISCNNSDSSKQKAVLDKVLTIMKNSIIMSERIDSSSFDRYSKILFEEVEKIIKNSSSNNNLNAENKVKTDKKIDLNSLLEELNSLIGLSVVKNDVNSLINFMQVQKVRRERGLPETPMSLHLVFTGNPGTGKTTVARIIAKIYHELGILSKGHLVEVDRAGLVGTHIGHTAAKTTEKIKEAMGGILFIDEAYTLYKANTPNDFGQEAIDTILKAMEDNRDDLIVIVAGYEKNMEGFLDSNPGLRSRFNKYIHFADYTAEELFEIFVGLCKKSGYTYSEELENVVKVVFVETIENKTKDFANGRYVRNFFEKAIAKQANRIATIPNFTTEQLMQLTVDDIVINKPKINNNSNNDFLESSNSMNELMDDITGDENIVLDNLALNTVNDDVTSDDIAYDSFELINVISKGQKYDLLNDKSISNLKVKLKWKYKDAPFVINVTGYLLGVDGRVLGDEWFVFYGQLNSPDNAVNLHENNNIYVDIDLNKINPNVNKIVVATTLNIDEERFDFSNLEELCIQICNGNDLSEIVGFKLADYYKGIKTIVIGEIYKYKDTWKFNAIGNGLDKSIEQMCEYYGVAVE